LADVAGRTLDLELSEGEAMKLAGGGQAAAAPDGAAVCRVCFPMKWIRRM
jgi:hypothetical protein